MKKLFIALLFIFVSVVSFSDVEVSFTQDYRRSILTGATKKTNEKVRVAIVNEVPKLHDWDYLYGIEYQFKDKKNEQEVVPQIGVRYYPINLLPVFAESTLGVEIKPDSNRYNTIGEVGIGIGRDGVVGNWYVSVNDVKQISTGIRLGYKF